MQIDLEAKIFKGKKRKFSRKIFSLFPIIKLTIFFNINNFGPKNFNAMTNLSERRYHNSRSSAHIILNIQLYLS